MSALTGSLVEQVRALPTLTFGEASSISNALADSRFDATSKASLNAAITERAVTATSASHVPSPANGTQGHIYPLVYCIKKDLDTLKSPEQPVFVKTQTIAERMCSLGVKSPSEQTIKHWAALMLACVWTACLPTKQESYQLVNDLKSAIANIIVPPHVQAIALTSYPALPAQLPPALLNAAYGVGQNQELPTPALDLEARYKIMLPKVILRCSSYNDYQSYISASAVVVYHS